MAISLTLNFMNRIHFDQVLLLGKRFRDLSRMSEGVCRQAYRVRWRLREGFADINDVIMMLVVHHRGEWEKVDAGDERRRSKEKISNPRWRDIHAAKRSAGGVQEARTQLHQRKRQPDYVLAKNIYLHLEK